MGDLIVGTYRQRHGAGVYPVRETSDGWEVGKPYGEAANASFGTWSSRHGLFYLLDEQGHALGIFRRGDEAWERLARIETNGAEPCHLALDAEEARLAIANYGSGSVTLFGIDPTNGLPVAPEQVHRNGGHGPVAERQDAPHAHWVGFRDDLLFQTDLGTDEILVFRIGPDGRLGAPSVAFHAPPGSGPRFIAFHPTLPIAYLVSELASTLTVLAIDGDALRPRATLSTLPDDFAGESLGGHVVIGVAAEHLYVTNRGHDSVAVFALAEDGMPRLAQHVPSGGASPRFLMIDDDAARLFVANEEGGTVAAMRIEADGRLTPEGTPIAVPGAVFLCPDRIAHSTTIIA